MCKVYSPCLKDAAYGIPLHLEYWFTRRRVLHVFSYISLCKMKRPLVWPFLGGFYLYVQTLQIMSQGCCMSKYLDSQFMRRRSFKVHQMLPPFSPYGAPISDRPLTFTNLNPNSPKILSTKFGSNRFNGFREEVVFRRSLRTTDGTWSL